MLSYQLYNLKNLYQKSLQETLKRLLHQNGTKSRKESVSRMTF